MATLVVWTGLSVWSLVMVVVVLRLRVLHRRLRRLQRRLALAERRLDRATQRANHTGLQPISTVAGLEAALAHPLSRTGG